jgi:hypothetical protein
MELDGDGGGGEVLDCDFKRLINRFVLPLRPAVSFSY